MTNIEIAAAIYIAYLVGSISSAIVVCKLMGLPDPRTKGSHNPGATNVLRLGGRLPAVFTLLGDVLKGFLPVLIGIWYGFSPTVLSIIAFAAFLGHLFPIFFSFNGGKGVATALGCLFALSWPTALCAIATWFIIALLSRYASLASMISSLLVPLYIGYFTHQPVYVIAMTIISLIIILRHRGNIAKLIAGHESKLGKKQK